jgi:hypothetical protein
MQVGYRMMMQLLGYNSFKLIFNLLAGLSFVFPNPVIMLRFNGCDRLFYRRIPLANLMRLETRIGAEHTKTAILKLNGQKDLIFINKGLLKENNRDSQL